MVGMPDVAVRESRERIKSALINSGFGYPNKTRHHQPGAGQRAQGGRAASICRWRWEFWARWEW